MGAVITVRVFCDDEADGLWDYPCWCQWPDNALPAIWHGNTTHAPDLPILRDLALWNRHYSSWFVDWENSLCGLCDAPRWFDPDAFTAEGLRLAFALKQNHPGWRVHFFDEVAYARQGEARNAKAGDFWREIGVAADGSLVLSPRGE